MITVFIVGLLVGGIIGHTVGTVQENTLWLDAVCGRKKIVNSVRKDHD